MTENKYVFNKDEIKRIKLESAVIPMTVTEVEGADQIEVIVKCDDMRFPYTCKQKGDKLKLKFKNTTVKHPKKLYEQVKNEGAGIWVNIPAGCVFDKFSMVVAASKGEVTLLSVKAAKGHFEVGAGELLVSGLDITELNHIEIGLGNFAITTPGTGSFEVDCGLGNVKLNLGRALEYYNYGIECGLGCVRVNNAKIGKSFLANNVMNNSGAEHSIKISCGLGNVDVNTLN